MNRFSRKEARDAGIAVAFVIIIISYIKGSHLLLPVAIGFLAAALLFPAMLRFVFAPLRFLFFRVIGPLLSRLFLAATFYLVITPLGLLRRMTGSDPMQLRKWKNGDESAFKTRDRLFTGKDLEPPY